MKKILLLITLWFLPVHIAFALGGVPAPVFGNLGALMAWVCGIFNWLFFAAIIMTIGYTIWAGILFIKSGGQGIDKIRDSLMYIAIGFAVVLIAKGAPSLVASILGTSLSGSAC